MSEVATLSAPETKVTLDGGATTELLTDRSVVVGRALGDAVGHEAIDYGNAGNENGLEGSFQSGGQAVAPEASV
jgi:hypothetical protein